MATLRQSGTLSVHQPIPRDSINSDHDALSRFILVILNVFDQQSDSLDRISPFIKFFIKGGMLVTDMYRVYQGMEPLLGRMLEANRRELMASRISIEEANWRNDIANLQQENQGDGEGCAICLEGWGRNCEAVRVLPCKHRYHSHCVQRWFVQKRSCPVCRFAC